MLLFSARPHWTLPELQTLTAPVLGASLLIAAGALVAIFVRDHLVLLLVSGLVGYGCAVLFLFTGAPDLAFTQFAVETIFVVVVAAVLLRLRRMPLGVRMAPAEARLRPPALGIAIAFGATLTALVLIVSGLPYDSTLADFYGEHSLTAAHGRNVVNLILVDFRALDTLGEIAVLAFALLAALPLLKRLGGRQP
jgi:multicomponent Na+:H+ antiporter subunit A